MPVDDVDTRPATTRPLTRRERLRRQTVDEIVERALELVDTGGAHGLSIASVSKAMGMTPPALYHYFASREALLDALVLAGYTDLGIAVEAAAHAAADRPAANRVSAIAHAWRRWALEHPRRYAMLFTGVRREAVDPLEHVGPITQSMLALVTALEELERDAGGVADGEGPAGGSGTDNVGGGSGTEQAVRSGRVNAAAGGSGTDNGGRSGTDNAVGGRSGTAPEPGTRQGLDAELSRWGRALGAPPETPPGALRLALSTWYRVHGLVSLELVGGFDTMGLDGGTLLTAEIESLVREATR